MSRLLAERAELGHRLCLAQQEGHDMENKFQVHMWSISTNSLVDCYTELKTCATERTVELHGH